MGSRPATSTAPARDKPGFAENRHVDQDGVALGPFGAGSKPVGRVPRGKDGRRALACEQAGVGKAKRRRSRQDQRGGTLVAALAGEHPRPSNG